VEVKILRGSSTKSVWLRACLPAILGAWSTVASGQERNPGIKLESITVVGNYWWDDQLKPGEGLHGARGIGGGVHVRFEITPLLSLGLSGGYADLKIDQDRAVDRWNWGFWERFYRNYVQDLQQRDPNYVATFTPNQRLQLLPALMWAEVDLPLRMAVRPRVSLGVSLYRYRRTLTLHERWEKRFPELNYSYVYEFDNHADNRSGTLFGLVGGAGVRRPLYRFVEVHAQGRYHWVFQRWARHDAYRYFPLKRFLEASLGVVFRY